MLESTSTTVSDHELHLLNIKPLTPGEQVTAAWLQDVSEHVSTGISEAAGHIGTLQHELDGCKSKVHERVSAIRSLLSSHHKLMSDVRSILKTMAKLEEQDYGEEVNTGGIREYLASYKAFSENITSALKAVVSDEVTRASMVDAQAVVQHLIDQIPSAQEKRGGEQQPITENVFSRPRAGGRLGCQQPPA
nr:hypothetical protein BaRGS_003885 [Batillaria attramentaria]